MAGLVPTELGAKSEPESGLAITDLELPGASKAGKFVRSARLLLDTETPPERLLILLHGRGEADSPKLALQAWSHLYGLLDAHARLREPPVRALLDRPRWEPDRAERINAELASKPFRGLALVCPMTPNPAAYGNRPALFRDYTEWLTTELVPLVRSRVPSLGGRVGLDGCSMGGYVALEVFLSRPEAFGTLGTVQAAIGKDRADAFAARLARLNAERALPPVHLLTSTQDPFREANERLSQRLRSAEIPHHLEVIPGPHNQPWLRQIGTLEMLRWHDRAL